MQWFTQSTDLNTNARRARRLRRMREQVEAWWSRALEHSMTCSRVVTVLEYAEANLDQDLFARKNPVWRSAQGRVIKAMGQGMRACQGYLKQEPAPQLLWTRQCLAKAQEVCRERQCRPNPEVEYLERDGEKVPVCGALEYLSWASIMPPAEDIYESRARNWDPDKFKSQGGRNAATDNW
jgi:hypothetical protein